MPVPTNLGKSEIFTLADDKIILREYPKGTRLKDIAALLDHRVTRGQIKHRAFRLGARRVPVPQYTDEQIQYITEAWPNDVPTAEIAGVLGVSHQTTRSLANRLGLYRSPGYKAKIRFEANPHLSEKSFLKAGLRIDNMSDEKIAWLYKGQRYEDERLK